MYETDERPRLAGVCGMPIGHSKSPKLFRHWFGVYGIDGFYVPLLIEPQDFETALRGLVRAGFRGVNVTIPHKLDALNLADTKTEAALAIGAANTLTFSRDGTINADNTDGYGFLANLKAGAPDWDPASGPALMIGAGGASRAAIHALLDAGAPEIRLANRTRETAERLAGHFGDRVTVVDWIDRSDAAEGVATIANSSSLGMNGNPKLDLALEQAAPTTLVTDMVYAPLETALLHDARARGLRTVDGLGMLLHQARPGFQRWFGTDPVVDQGLRQACLEQSQ